MPKPICVFCAVEYRCEQNGFYVHVSAGDEQPYQIWATDKWRCPNCNHEIAIRGAQQLPVSTFGMDDRERFARHLERCELVIA